MNHVFGGVYLKTDDSQHTDRVTVRLYNGGVTSPIWAGVRVEVVELGVVCDVSDVILYKTGSRSSSLQSCLLLLSVFRGGIKHGFIVLTASSEWR